MNKITKTKGVFTNDMALPQTGIYGNKKHTKEMDQPIAELEPYSSTTLY
ncbi:hypothetical protein OA501_02705 [Flavobacteriaceae bacterium]|nr:hypothetical protein [Flavobacteriaceae bacterium]